MAPPARRERVETTDGSSPSVEWSKEAKRRNNAVRREGVTKVGGFGLAYTVHKGVVGSELLERR
jgi:hypothetical protein